jgi:hypothetical protein
MAVYQLLSYCILYCTYIIKKEEVDFVGLLPLVVFHIIQPRGMQWALCEMIMTNRYTKGLMLFSW